MTVLLVLLGTILALPTTTNAQLVFQEEAADPDFKTLIKTYEPGKNFSHQSIVLKTSVLSRYIKGQEQCTTETEASAEASVIFGRTASAEASAKTAEPPKQQKNANIWRFLPFFYLLSLEIH